MFVGCAAGSADVSVAVNALACMVEHLPRTWRQLAATPAHTASEAVWAWAQLGALLDPTQDSSESSTSSSSPGSPHTSTSRLPGQLRVLQPRKSWWHDAFFAQTMPPVGSAAAASAGTSPGLKTETGGNVDAEGPGVGLVKDFIVAQGVVCGCLFGLDDPHCVAVGKWLTGTGT